jgi:ATP phosphoribosyltransferase regulatory subunit
MPLRCFYIGSLYRYEEPQAGRKREFTQAGIELIGANTAEADAEVVAQAIAALEALNLEGFQVNLGQMAFFRSLTQGLDGGPLEIIREAIDHKNGARLQQGLDRAGLAGPRRHLLRRLPDLIGGPEVLAEAQALAQDSEESAGALVALERLAQVFRLLQGYRCADRVTIDLGEVRGMDYYTGITFRGVAPSLGWPLISGGRYDDLIAGFGRSMPAVGFGLGVERALLVQPRQESLSAAPHLIVHSCHRIQCLDAVRTLRQLGCRVAVDVRGLEPAELAENARLNGVERTLFCTEGHWLLVDGSGERSLTLDELLREASTWPASIEC